MAAVSEEVKLFIVQRLAVFDTQVQVIEAVKETFGIEVTRQQVYFYDPTVGKKPAQKWIREFRRTRRRFLKRIGDVPIANKAVRLQRLDRLQATAEKSKNLMLAKEILEQAAKEMGGAFTNRREITGKNGAPVIGQADPTDEMNDEELLAHAQSIVSALKK
ncbi:MAG: DUF2280 domain-containing protein [Gemmatimonas sp.]